MHICVQMEKIAETQFTRLQDLQRFNARDCADFAYLTLLALQILKHEFNFMNQTRDYARKTIRHYSFNAWHSGCTDLYILLYVLHTRSIKHLNPHADNKILLQRVGYNQTHMTLHLRELSQGYFNPTRERMFFYDLENSLMIIDSNYKSIRKLVLQWAELSQHDRELVITRLMQAFRVRMPRMDLRTTLEQFIGMRSLELDNVRNIEQERVSKEHRLKMLKLLAAKKRRMK